MGIGKVAINLGVGGIALAVGYFAGLRKKEKQMYNAGFEKVMTPELKVEVLEAMQVGLNNAIEHKKAEWRSPGD